MKRLKEKFADMAPRQQDVIFAELPTFEWITRTADAREGENDMRWRSKHMGSVKR